jgi:hypothetical protein
MLAPPVIGGIGAQGRAADRMAAQFAIEDAEKKGADKPKKAKGNRRKKAAHKPKKADVKGDKRPVRSM